MPIILAEKHTELALAAKAKYIMRNGLVLEKVILGKWIKLVIVGNNRQKAMYM